MKKSRLAKTYLVAIIGLILLGVGILFGIGPLAQRFFASSGVSNIPFATFDSLFAVITVSLKEVFTVFSHTGANAFTKQIWQYAIWGFAAFYALVTIIYVIVVCKNKKPSLLLHLFPGLLFAASVIYFLGMGYSMLDVAGNNAVTGWNFVFRYTYIVNNPELAQLLPTNYWITMFVYLFAVGFVMYIVSVFLEFIFTLVYSHQHRLDNFYKKHPELLEESKTTVVNNIISDSKISDKTPETVNTIGTQKPINNVHSQSAPIVVQYFNSYGRSEDTPFVSKEAGAAPSVQKDSLTKEDVEEIIKGLLAKETKEEVKIQEVTQNNQQGITIDDIRNIIKEELSEAKNEMTLPNVSVSNAYNNEPIKHEETRTSKNKVRSDKAPIIVALPQNVPVADDLKEEIVEEVEIKEEGITEDELRDVVSQEISSLFEELKKEIIAKEAAKVVEEPVEEVEEETIEEVEEPTEEIVEETEETTIENKVTEEVVKDTFEEEIPETIEEVEETPAQEQVEEVEEVVEEPVEELVQEETLEENDDEEATISRGAEVKVEKKEVIRLPFNERLGQADEVLKNHYNNLKALLMSFGLKSRVSNSGDAFRLHKITYCKITVAGKSLKLYFALDPKDYENSAIPVSDASSKAVYKDIPLVFKVKSDLSLRRARDLIHDTMDKAGIDQVNPEVEHDYFSELVDALTLDDDSEE